MLKKDKVTLVSGLSQDLQGVKSVVLVNYSGLNVKAQQDLKSRLKEVGGRMLVVKNTLLKRAFTEAKLDEQTTADTVLSGQTALIVADEDGLATIQVLGKFMKEFELPKFKVGVVEGSFQDSESLLKLSTLPGRDALLGQLLGSLISSMYGLVGTLQNPMNSLVFTLDQKAKGGDK